MVAYSVKEINEHLLFDYAVDKTDVGLLLGARCVSGDLARHAAKLMDEGMFDKVIVSGGLPVFQPHVAFALAVTGQMSLTEILRRKSDFVSRKMEAEYMRDVLLQECGVSEDRILMVENKSRNTGDNIQNTQALLRKFNSIGIVTAAYH